MSRFGKEVKNVFARPAKAPDFVTKNTGACEERDIPFSTYMRSHDEVDSNSSEDEDIPRMEKLFPEPSEDELYTPQVTSVVWKSAFKDGKYLAWLILKQLTDQMTSKVQRDMYTRASLQYVLAHDALCVGKDAIGLDRLTASILTTAQTTQLHELHALALAAARQVKREVSSEMQVLPHCGLSLRVAASIVQVHMYVMMQAWAKAREALKPLLKRDDLCNRADVCYHIGSSLMWTGDHDEAILWHERGIAADPTFHINFCALGFAMILSKWINEADPERKSLIMETAEKHLWQYVKQGVPEDKKYCDVLYDLVSLALLSVNFQKAHHLLEMAIEADIRRTQIYNEPSDCGGKKALLIIATLIEVAGATCPNDPQRNLFLATLRTKLCGNSLLICLDFETQLKNLSAFLHTMRDFVSQNMTTSFWSGDKSESEFAANILKKLTQNKDSDDSVGREDDENEEQGEKTGMQHIVVDCEGSGEFLSLGEALRSGCIATGTVITMKGGTYKENIGLCIEHEHLTIRAESSKEKVVIKSYDGIRVEASHVTLSGLSVDLLSPKGYDGVEELDGHAIHVRAGTAVVLENCSANSATCAAIGIGDSVQSSEIEVTMVMCNARSSVGNAIICTGSHTKVQLQQCNGTHSKNGLEVRMGATAHVRSSNFSCNKDSGVLVWQHASAETVVGPDNVIQDNQGSGALLESQGIVFHHNKVTGNKLFGVSVQPDPALGFIDVEVKVEGCELFLNGCGGVQFCDGACGVISGCYIKENNRCGIVVGMGVDKLSIAGNRIQGNYSLQETGIMMQGRAKVAGDNEFSNNRMTLEKAEEFLKTLIELELVCSYCNTIAIREPYKKCGKCRHAAYCSKQCQKKHWPVHKAVCKSAPKESCSQKTKAGASSFVTVKATTQNPLEAKCKVKVNCGNLVADCIMVCYLQLVHFVKVMHVQMGPISCFLFKLNFTVQKKSF